MSVASFYQNLGGRPDRRPFLSTLEPSKHADILVIQKVFLFTFWGGWPIPPQTPPIDVTASSRIMYTCTTGICLIYLVGKKIPTQIPDCCRRRQHRQNWSDRHRPFPKFHWTRLLHVPRLKRNFLPIWRLRIQHTVQLHTFWSQSSSKVSKKINYSVRKWRNHCARTPDNGGGVEGLKRWVFKRFLKTVGDGADATFCGSVPRSGNGDRKSSIFVNRRLQYG